MSTSTEYKRIRVTGVVNVVCTTPPELKGKVILVYILMGPTGSGKSAFIESLSSDGALSISKDSLESVTHEVVCYQVVNLEANDDPDFRFILMDTPGFLDTKLSESKITTMILSTLDAFRESAAAVGVSIYYFHPITDIRMGGSKRNAVRLLRAFGESFGAAYINIVTTMWNTLSTPNRTVDANQRLDALKADIFQQSGDMEIGVQKFEFHRVSALSIIEGSYWAWVHDKDKSGNVNRQFQSMVLNNLLQRIDNALQQLQQLAEDRKNAHILVEEDHLLLEVINHDELVALAALSSFLDDLHDLNPGQCSSPFPREDFLPPSSSALTSSGPISPSLGIMRLPLSALTTTSSQRTPLIAADVASHISPSSVPALAPTPSESRIRRVVAPVKNFFKHKK